MLRLDQEIKYLQGVGPQRAKLLEGDLGIKTVGDLLEYFPYKYIDRSRFYHVSELNGTMPYVQLYGEILSFQTEGTGSHRRVVAHFSDGTGVVDLVWFHGAKYVTQTYETHRPYVVFGSPKPFRGRYNIAHPEIEKPQEGLTPNYLPEGQQQLFGELEREPNPLPWGRDAEARSADGYLPDASDSMGNAPDTLSPSATASQPQAATEPSPLRPAYNTSAKMKAGRLNSQTIAKLTATLLRLLDQPLPETLPPYIVERFHFISRDAALRNIHYPQSPSLLRKAQARLKFEELFYVQLNILRYMQDRQRHFRGIVMQHVGEPFNEFYYHHLPFQLTGAQKRVVKEIRQDMRSGRQMNRLLQGDVGCGKTLVALMCALIVIGNGCQVCLMAPTEILAEQHLATLRTMLGDMSVRVELLTGQVKGRRRQQVLDGLLRGEIDILVGTHAVIEEQVQFDRLGLAVIDEQHRFGVAQRAKLWQKSDTPPHVLVMTATPIPRTLAMTLYGDLDVSVIDELPPGRKPVVTVHQFDRHRAALNQQIRRQLQQGRQVYMVYPLIRESEKIDLKNLENGYEQVVRDFPEYRVSRVHGQMKPAEKDAEMERFVRGETQILVATTVIEVGVNVPNATVMVIENAERFGLSQLHQLRGRVGRGADQSFCILVTGYKLSQDTRRRIQVMVDSNDGFEIAEQDLKLRGPGDLEGTQQSGMAFDLKIANLARDGILLQMARDVAAEVLARPDAEQNPANAVLWQRLSQLRKTNINWGAIS